MELINIVLGISNLFFGLILILLSIPLKRGSIKMNKLYGFRLEKSFESEENWYKINSYGAERFILWSIPTFVVALVTFFIPFNENIILILLFAHAPLIVLIIAIIEVYHFAKKL